MSLINKMEQSAQLQNELNINVENGQGGLAVRTDLRAGFGEAFLATLQESWQGLMDSTASPTTASPTAAETV